MGLLGVYRRSLGISLKGDRASYVELGWFLGRIRVLHWGTLQLDASEIGPDVLNRWKRPDEVVVGLPRRATVLRFLDLPSVEEEDLDGLLAYEIEKHLPFPPDEACFGFQVLERNGGRVKVLVVAARRADVESAVEQVRRLGLQPTAVDVSALAAADAVLSGRRRKAETLALVGINGREAEVTVIERGTLRYSRAVPLDQGDQRESLLRELERALEGVGSPSRLLFQGGDEELGRLARAELGVEAEQWSPPWRLAGNGEPDAAALGLALRGVSRLPLKLDLLPPEQRPKRREPGVVVMLVLIALIAVLAGALGLSAAQRERKAFRDLRRQVGHVKARALEAEALKTDFSRLRTHLQVLERIAREQGRPLVALKELVEILPADVLLTEFIVEERKVQIRGTTTASAADLISAFERSALFENAAFTSPIAAQGDRQGFQLQVFVKGQ